jgi:hypothetical protein
LLGVIHTLNHSPSPRTESTTESPMKKSAESMRMIGSRKRIRH